MRTQDGQQTTNGPMSVITHIALNASDNVTLPTDKTKLDKENKTKTTPTTVLQQDKHTTNCHQADHSPDNVKFRDISLTVRGTPPLHSAC